MQNQENLSIYIHVPFCRKRCNYCDFNTYAGMGAYLEEYIIQLEREIERAAEFAGSKYRVHTVYFGGGTPTLMKPEHYWTLLACIKKNYEIAGTLEVSTEANPFHLSLEYLEKLNQSGVNRLSMGMQSAVQEELDVLGRIHRMVDVEQSVEFARKAGFNNINLDLIFGLPYQDLTSFQASVEKALSLEPEHLSIYSLTIEQGTPLEKMIRKGEIPEPDQDLGADMYAWVMEFLDKKGFNQYEISNWAVQDKYRCLHNLQYWHYRSYLGFGAGAHSYFENRRWANIGSIPGYIQSLAASLEWDERNPPAAEELTILSQSDSIQESMMMGLRLVEEGVSYEEFQARFGQSMKTIYKKEISELIEKQLLEEVARGDKQILRLTHKGKMLGNQVFMQFINA